MVSTSCSSGDSWKIYKSCKSYIFAVLINIWMETRKHFHCQLLDIRLKISNGQNLLWIQLPQPCAHKTALAWGPEWGYSSDQTNERKREGKGVISGFFSPAREMYV